MKWILISGLGADHRLFDNLIHLLPNHQILAFEIPAPHETIEHYALRLFEQADVDGPLVLCGVSFGGMLCSILCEQVGAEALVLMASTQRPVALKTSLRAFEWMSRVMPDALAQWIRGLGRNAARWIEPINKQQLDDVKEMASAAPLDLVRRGARMIMDWREEPGVSCPRYHLHGRKDLLIPFEQVEPTHVLHDAGHLLNLTHGYQVQDFVRFVQQDLERVAVSK